MANTSTQLQPPELDAGVKVLKKEDLSLETKPWKDIKKKILPVDFLLMTVKDFEFLGCLSFLSGLEKSYLKSLGYVHFGAVGNGEKKMKVAVLQSEMGSSTTGGSLVSVQNAVRILKPKAVFYVGICASLNERKAKLGDVVVSRELATYSSMKQTEKGIEDRNHKVPIGRNLLKLIQHIGNGWKPPLKKPADLKVEVRKDAVFLSGPEVVDSKKRRDELIRRFSVATAIECEGEGLFAAAHDLDIEWIIIKGVSDYADGKKSQTDSWRPFASIMAASVVAHTLKDVHVFKSWRNYKDEDDSDDEDSSPRKRRRSPSPSSSSDSKRNKGTAGHSECFLPRVVSQGPFGLESESDPMECESQAETDSKLEDLQQQEEMKIGPNALSQNMLQSTSNESESCLVDKSGSLWKLQEIQAAACIAFAPNAVPTAILFKCTLLGSTMELLPLAKNEELVSDVIQLSYSELSGTSFTGEFDETVTVALSHSAAKLEGYEVVISELVDSTKREWKDLETTNVWENSDVEENLLSRLRVPYAEAKVTRCSTYAVLYRLKSHTYLIDHSRNQKFTCRIPEYPDVQVTIPAEIVTKGNLQLTLKVQEIPEEWLEESGVLAGPVLHITCSSAIQLLEPAEITLPMSLSANEEQYVDFSTRDIVVSANSDDGTTGWKDITKELPRPPELNDRVVTFQVRHFTRFLVSRKERKRLRRQSRLYHHADSKPRTAGFAACLCRVDEFSRNSQLRFCCYPSHLEKRVRQEWFSTYSVSLYGCGSSNEKLCDDEKITARPYGGLKLRKEASADELILRFNRLEKYESEVIVQRNRGEAQIKFFKKDGSKCLRNMTIVTPQKTQVSQDARGTSEAGDSSENMKISSSHGGPTLKRLKKIKDGVKKDCPSLEELLDLSQKLVKWKPLGRFLLDMDESTIARIHKENEELEEKAYQMLRHWKIKKHKKATYQALFSALCRIDRKDLAKEFCRAGTSTF